MGELGLLGVPWPEELGGTGMDQLSYYITIHEMAKVDASHGLTISAHTNLGTSPIVEFGTEEQGRRYVPLLASGRVMGGFGLTEPGAGSDAGGTATVTNLGQTKTFEAPRRFFTAQSYAPLSARALLIRYWKQIGQPEHLAVLPGEPTRDVRIAFAGSDNVTVGGVTRVLSRYTVDGIVWGRETVWLDEGGRFAAIVTRISSLIARPLQPTKVFSATKAVTSPSRRVRRSGGSRARSGTLRSRAAIRDLASGVAAARR